MGDLGNKEVMGENIKYYMQLHGIDRRQLAYALDAPYTTVTSWIKAENYPRIDRIEQMANYFNISKADLVERHTQSQNVKPICSSRDWATPLVEAYHEAKRPTREAVCNVLQIPYVGVDNEPEPVTIPTTRFDCAAGIPVWVGDGDMEDREYPPGVVPRGTSFAIHIAGDSMSPTIPDGAYVFIRQQPDLRNNEIGVFMLYDEATCKRFYKDKSGVKLISDNPKYDTIVIEKDMEGFGLVGKVLGHYKEG